MLLRITQLELLLLLLLPTTFSNTCHDLDATLTSADLITAMSNCTLLNSDNFGFKQYPATLDLSSWTQQQFKEIFIKRVGSNNIQMTIAANVTVENSELEDINLIAIYTNKSGPTMTFTVKNNKKLLKVAIGIATGTAEDVKLSLVIHGNSLLTEKVLSKVKKLAKNSTVIPYADIQSFGECYFDGKPIGTLEDLSNCKSIGGDLKINKNTSLSLKTRQAPIKRVEGCIEITDTNLNNTDFLDPIDLKVSNCKSEHKITNNGNLCRYDKIFKLLSENKKVGVKNEKNMECDQICTKAQVIRKEPGDKCNIIVGDFDVNSTTVIADFNKLWGGVEEVIGHIKVHNRSDKTIEIFPNLERINSQNSNKHAIHVANNTKLENFSIPKLKKISMTPGSVGKPIYFENNGPLKYSSKERKNWQLIAQNQTITIPLENSSSKPSFSPSEVSSENNNTTKTSSAKNGKISGVAVLIAICLILLVAPPLVIFVVLWHLRKTLRKEGQGEMMRFSQLEEYSNALQEFFIKTLDCNLKAFEHKAMECAITCSHGPSTIDKQTLQEIGITISEPNEEKKELVEFHAADRLDREHVQRFETLKMGEEREFFPPYLPRQEFVNFKKMKKTEPQKMGFDQPEIYRWKIKRENYSYNATLIELATEEKLQKYKEDMKKLCAEALAKGPEKAKKKLREKICEENVRFLAQYPNRFFYDDSELLKDMLTLLTGNFYGGRAYPRIKGPVIICGDILGSLTDVQALLSWDPTINDEELVGAAEGRELAPFLYYRYLFLGNIVGGGTNDMETLILLCSLAIIRPGSVTILRGTQECHPESSAIYEYFTKRLPNLTPNAQEKLRQNEDVTKEMGLYFHWKLMKLFQWFPLVCLINNGEAFCCHGGPTKKLSYFLTGDWDDLLNKLSWPYMPELVKRSVAFPRTMGKITCNKSLIPTGLQKDFEIYVDERQKWIGELKKEKRTTAGRDVIKNAMRVEKTFSPNESEIMIYYLLWNNPSATFEVDFSDQVIGESFNRATIRRFFRNAIEGKRKILIRSNQDIGYQDIDGFRTVTLFTNYACDLTRLPLQHWDLFENPIDSSLSLSAHRLEKVVNANYRYNGLLYLQSDGTFTNLRIRMDLGKKFNHEVTPIPKDAEDRMVQEKCQEEEKPLPLLPLPTEKELKEIRKIKIVRERRARSKMRLREEEEVEEGGKSKVDSVANNNEEQQDDAKQPEKVKSKVDLVAKKSENQEKPKAETKNNVKAQKKVEPKVEKKSAVKSKVKSSQPEKPKKPSQLSTQKNISIGEQPTKTSVVQTQAESEMKSAMPQYDVKSVKPNEKEYSPGVDE